MEALAMMNHYQMKNAGMCETLTWASGAEQEFTLKTALTLEVKAKGFVQAGCFGYFESDDDVDDVWLASPPHCVNAIA